MNDKAFLKLSEKVLDNFCSYMKDKGYSVFDYNDEYLGYGATANKKDKFVPMLGLHIFTYPQTYSIFVTDRNGNSILTGETAAIYSLNIENCVNSKDVITEFENMLNDVYKKYSIYSRENRLDFAFNNLEEERKEYTLPTDKNKDTIDKNLDVKI